MHLPLYQVDAFTNRLFSGNPAAVCPLDTWLPDATMQAIAAENNLSETAFFVPRGPHGGDDYDLRWFTPAIEVDLCGHATLASGFIVLTKMAPQKTSVRFHTQSGPLTVSRDGSQFALDLPSRPPTTAVMPEKYLAALGGKPKQILAARKYLVVYETANEVAALTPDFATLKSIDKDGVIATAPGPDARLGTHLGACDFVSRYFAPHAGVDEDPVTGSAHCTLVPYWAQRLGKITVHARQISARGGELFCDLKGDRVRMAGGAVLYLEGRVHL